VPPVDALAGLNPSRFPPVHALAGNWPFWTLQAICQALELSLADAITFPEPGQLVARTLG
jgi:hypothetical protein